MLDVTKFGTDQRVAFGAGRRFSVPEVAEALNAQRVLVLTTPHQSSLGLSMAEVLGSGAVGLFSRATMHTPVDVTKDALAHYDEIGADAVLSVGGGSTIGLGKALGLRRDLIHIAVPTTYAGSECTPILGQTENGVKTTLTDARVRPDQVIYDAELVATLPAGMTVTSGLNAMAHAAEALYAKDRNDRASDLASLGLQCFASSLPQVVENPGDLDAREATQQGAWACGTVLGQVGMALHHKLCHTLGGSFDLPHAETHAVVLPHALAYNAPASPELVRQIEMLFDDTDAGGAVWRFARDLGAPLALRDLGLNREDLDRAADLAVSKPYWNPREITRDGLRALLERAWEGAPPQA